MSKISVRLAAAKYYVMSGPTYLPSAANKYHNCVIIAHCLSRSQLQKTPDRHVCMDSWFFFVIFARRVLVRFFELGNVLTC